MMIMRSLCSRRLLLPLISRPTRTRPTITTSDTTVATARISTTTTTAAQQQQQHSLSDVLAAMDTNNSNIESCSDESPYDEDQLGHMAYSLSFASLDGYNPFPPLLRPLMAREHEQLRISHDQLRLRTITNTSSTTATTATAANATTVVMNNNNDDELPRTLEDALRPSKRAIVVTEPRMPFNVVDVNKAWEDLCGYKYTECHGRSLGSLIKGPQTDPLTVTALINQLLRGEDATAVITNYKKDGRPFQNRLRVGPLYKSSHSHNGSAPNHQEVSHFVGILEEVA
mmetsp:Transcript_26446/g.62958  ORF Transcript_26446/g.62958 Transcript_26446/m.62958 type:complete len:285 (+) Transcript_26446:114-968(+)